MRIVGLLLFVLAPIWLSPASAGQVTVAVATNFLAPLRALAPGFEAATGHRLRISGGSTGKLYAQIVNGAPFDVFLAANHREPERLEREGYTVADSRFTYARGELVLWSGGRALVPADGAALLRSGAFRRLALANPKTAPYGAAAVAVLRALDVDAASRHKLARGENVGQAYQFVATGNADLGFVALSQVVAASNGLGNADGSGVGNEIGASSWWRVPADLYPAIEQQAVLLRHGADNPAALAFVEFLDSPAVRQRIAEFGYRPADAASHEPVSVSVR